MQLSSVVFPEPEAPTMAVNLPFSTPRVIPSRAFTWRGPWPKVLVRLVTVTMSMLAYLISRRR